MGQVRRSAPGQQGVTPAPPPGLLVCVATLSEAVTSVQWALVSGFLKRSVLLGYLKRTVYIATHFLIRSLGV